MSYPGEPWRSTRTNRLLESRLLGTGTGFGSAANTGGFGSTNTTGGGLFGGGSTGFGSTGGMSTTLSCSGIFCGLDIASLAQSSVSISNVASKVFFPPFPLFFCGSSNDQTWTVNVVLQRDQYQLDHLLEDAIVLSKC